MIGELPKSLEIDNATYEINSDFRVALLIFQAFNDPELDQYCKALVCLKCLYKEVPANTEQAIKKAMWFLDGEDESIIFPAINKVAGYETREVKYLHWWTFLGLFNEIGDGLFSQVMNIRGKKSKGKKLEKWEREFYSSHKELIDLKRKATSQDEQQELDFINNII